MSAIALFFQKLKKVKRRDNSVVLFTDLRKILYATITKFVSIPQQDLVIALGDRTESCDAEVIRASRYPRELQGLSPL